MPRIERGFLLGSLIGFVAAIGGFIVDFSFALLAGAASLPSLGEGATMCDAMDVTFDLAFSGVVAIAVGGMLGWFVAKNLNASRDAEQQLSARSAAVGAVVVSTLLMILVTAGGSIFFCNDPLAV